MFVATRTWLVAVALVVGMASVAAQKKCSATQITACMSCSKVGRCSSTTLTLSLAKTCSSSQVCQESGNSAMCVPASSTNVCNNCGSQPIGCDPYNPLIRHVCIPGMPPLPLRPCTSPQKCSAGVCVDSTSDTNSPAAVCASKNPTPAQFYSLKPACTSGVLCSGTYVVNIYNCTSGNYFNQKLSSCKSLPVNHCSDGGITDGFAPNLTDCSKGVVCQGGAVVNVIACDTGKIFSNTINGCIVRPPPSQPSGCSDMDGCTLASSGPVNTTSSGNGPSSSTTSTSTTTAKPPRSCSASNVNKRYPHPSDPKRYYKCRLINGIYKYAELICNGNMVYNPTTINCEPPPTTPSSR